jgi:kynureninase
MDQTDTLSHYKSRFYLEKDTFYMDGNSLGLMSKDAEESMFKVMTDWKIEGIKIWGAKEGKYFMYPQQLGAKMSDLIHAKPEEVIALGSITTNIHQILTTLYQPTETRYKILVDELNFPTDIYAVKSVLRLKGYEHALDVIKSEDGKTLSEETIIAHMNDDVAVILLPAVLYRSAQLLDMKRLTMEAHKRGILIGWDLAHSIGAVNHDFNSFEPDFAVWCTYKYLNGGPGSVGGLYINRRHFDKSAGLQGWFGNKNDSQFQLRNSIDQTADASGWLQGTPHIMSLAALEGSLDMYLEAGIDNLRKKSLKLTDYLMAQINERLLTYGFTIGNPLESDRRGGHVCLEHDDAYRISSALRDYGVIPDFREPNVIRLAPVPLYVSFEDVYHVVEIIVAIVKNNKHESYSNIRETVV